MVVTHRVFLACLFPAILVGAVAAQEQAAEKPAAEKAIAEKGAAGIKGWGDVSGPDDVCTITSDQGKLTVTVPAGVFDLNRSLGGMKAPRILQPVEGDFTAQVKVTADFKPGDRAAGEGLSSFNGAGLLIWYDKDNYIRIERNAWWVAAAGKYASYPPLIEFYQEGKYMDTNPPGTMEPFFKGRSTWFKFQRKDTTLVISYSHDGKQWTNTPEIQAELPAKLQVGVAAINTADKPFKVEFDEFKVTKK